jgi:hypothetical protein
MRPQPRVQKVKAHTSVVATKTPDASGVPHAIDDNGLLRLFILTKQGK